jgi:hypothetical protein
MREVNGTSYHDESNEKVIEVLERVRQNGSRIRVHYGNVQNGQDWNDHYDVMGKVGRSMGPQRVPLLIHNSRIYFQAWQTEVQNAL